MLKMPCAPATFFVFSSASRSAARNSGVPGCAFFSATGMAAAAAGRRPRRGRRRSTREPLPYAASYVVDVVDAPTRAPGCRPAAGGDQHRAGRQERAFDVLAADAQEVGVGDAVGLVDLALVAALLQRLLRQRGRRAGAGDQHRVGLGRDILSTWPVTDVSVRAIALVGDDLDALAAPATLLNSLYQPSP